MSAYMIHEGRTIILTTEQVTTLGRGGLAKIHLTRMSSNIYQTGICQSNWRPSDITRLIDSMSKSRELIDSLVA